MRHLEDDLQIQCVNWFSLQYPNYHRLLFAVPNGGKRNIREAARLKKMGVVAGVADLLLLMPSKQYHALCIELKAGKGTQTAHQKEWQKIVEAKGYKYEVARSIEQFIEVITKHINEGSLL